MEDIRKLLHDAEREIAPESLAYVVHGLTLALADELRDGIPSDPGERLRHLKIRSALLDCVVLYSGMLARWMGRHFDERHSEK